MVHGVGGFLDGHPAGLDFLAGGAAEGQAGGQQPAGRQGGIEVAAFLAALDELEHPVEDWSVPAGVLLQADRGQVPCERVSGGYLPSGVEQPDQRDGGGSFVEPGGVEGRSEFCGGPFHDGAEQRLAGREVRVNGLPADPSGPGDVFDAGLGVGVQGVGGGLQDRGDAVPGFGSLPPSPGLRLRGPVRDYPLTFDIYVKDNLALT